MTSTSSPSITTHKKTNMRLVSADPERWKITGPLTRQQVAAEVGCTTKTLRKRCEDAGIKLPCRELLFPKLALRILSEFGYIEYE